MIGVDCEMAAHQKPTSSQQSNTGQDKIRAGISKFIVTRGLGSFCNMSYGCLAGVNGTTGGSKNVYTYFLTDIRLTNERQFPKLAQE